jgi:hypothetical protein
VRLPPGEPECGPWRPTDPGELFDLLCGTPAPSGPRVVAVDGRGGSGKTVLAGALAEVARARGTRAAVVHTDDVAWYQSFFGWDELLAEHVLAPVRAGRGADFRPRSWVERDRSGSITVPAGVGLVLVEGTGSARRSLARWVDAAVWVQVDAVLARERVDRRDGDTPATRRFITEWDAEEEPFMLREQPWVHCDQVVGSTAAGDWVLGQPRRAAPSAERQGSGLE